MKIPQSIRVFLGLKERLGDHLPPKAELVHAYKKILKDTEALKRHIVEKALQFISECMFYKTQNKQTKATKP